jgi:hypothetical protein
MADRKITELTAMSAGTQATGDLLTIVDVSEAAAVDKNKKITVESLFKGIPSNVGIGVTSPTQPLDVDGWVKTSVGLLGTTGRVSTASGGINISTGATANPIIFTGGTGSANRERMRIDSSGPLLINKTTTGSRGDSAPLQVKSGNSAWGINLSCRSNNDYAYFTFTSHDTNETLADIFVERTSTRAGYLAFATNNGNTNATERMRLDSSGRMLVGTSTSTTGASSQYANLQVIGNLSSATNRGALLNLGHSAASASVTTGELIGQVLFTDNAAGEYGFISCLADGNASSGDYPGRLVFSTTADGASSSTERMRLDSSGALLVGKTSLSNTTKGAYINQDGQLNIVIKDSGSAQQCIFLNREDSDGTLILFRQSNLTEGSISVSGSTVSYNGGHLSRWAQLAAGAARTEILRGSVLSNLNEMCEWGEEDNEQLNRMQVSDVEGDKNVSGVFQSWDDDDDTYVNDFYCAMTGDFVIRIAQGTTVARGDLLMSAGDGTAKPQDDDIVRSKTIAKVTSTTVSTTYSDNSYCVPCVLMAC